MNCRPSPCHPQRHPGLDRHLRALYREREPENEVSDDTIETLSVSKVDAEGEVFGDANETHKLEGTTLPLLIHEPSKCEILLNDV